LFWSSDGLAVFKTKYMWDNAANSTILRDEVESAANNELILKSGKRVPCDAVVAATGWSNTYTMFDGPLARTLGLPLLLEKAQDGGTEDMEWQDALKRADKKIIEAFPRLGNLPTYPDHVPKSTPNRLYRYMVPIDGNVDHSIAFVGAIGSAQSLNVAEIQALWVTAFLQKRLALPTEVEMKHDVALSTAWRKRRYLGDGYTFIFEHLQVSRSTTCFQLLLI
jgi:dimethylaniline monooxygenase (N-oxide forming)